MPKDRKLNNGLIRTKTENCVDCNKCLQECPLLRANVSVSQKSGKNAMLVDDKECTLCGTCLDACTHDAREYQDDTEKFISDLVGGAEFSLLIAPSFSINYPNEYKHVMGYLKSLGVIDFYAVGFGADITIWGYLNYISKSKSAGNIAQPCPAVISHIEKHTPSLLSHIIPIQSPALCLAIYLKKYHHISEDFVMLSPCISKKIEITSKRGGNLIKYNITFQRLMEHIYEQGINLKDFPQIEYESSYGMGSLFPTPGGMRENIEYYLGSESEVLQVDGEKRVYNYLEAISSGKAKDNMPVLVELLNCEGGCIYGTGSEFRRSKDYEAAHAYFAMRKKKYIEIRNLYHTGISDPKERLDALNERFQELDINDFVCEYENPKSSHKDKSEVSESEIEYIFASKLQKLTENDRHIDCRACGYDSCYSMAKAIALGINRCENCMHFTKATLSKNEERMTAIIESMPLCCMTFDSDFNISGCNEAMLSLLGLSNQHEIMKNFLKFSTRVQPNGVSSKEKFAAICDQITKEGRAEFEWTHRSSKGEPIPCEVTAIRTTRFGSESTVVFVKDMREHLENLEYSQTIEQRLQSMIDTSPIPCAVFDENYNILEANLSAVELFGTKDVASLLKVFFDLNPEFQPDNENSLVKMYNAMQQCFERGSIRMEWEHCDVNGALIPCEIIGKIVEIGDKKLSINYILDLREQKEVLAKLQSAIDREQKSNRAKSRFLSTMSHEIRTPMNAVLGITNIQLQNENNSAEIREAFLRIDNSSTLLLSLINDILDLSKVEAGKMELILDEYSVEEMIDGVTQLNLMYANDMSVNFVVSVDENLPARLYGDELRIKQIINNLLSNAFKYTSDGKVELSFKAEKSDATGEAVLVVRVEDTGQGMTKEEVENLFDVYTRYNIKENRAIQGTGLGMSIISQLLELMEGNVDVTSTPNVGSVFTVRIPQTQIGDEVLGKTASSRIQEFALDMTQDETNDKITPFPGTKVLVVDDVDTNVYVAEGILKLFQISVDTAMGGQEAVDKVIAGNEYDMIFMDHMMPGVDGIRATEMIREAGYKAPIIALTASAQKGAEEMFLKSGFSGFISKPVAIDKLRQILIRFLEKPRK